MVKNEYKNLNMIFQAYKIMEATFCSNEISEEGIILIKKIALKEVPIGEYYLGYLFWNGIGFMHNKILALTYFEKALLHCNKEIRNNILYILKDLKS